MYIMVAAQHANLSKLDALLLNLHLIWRQETCYGVSMVLCWRDRDFSVFTIIARYIISISFLQPFGKLPY